MTQVDERGLSGATDYQLLRLYVDERSGEAFGELVRRHTASVYATCLRVLNDPHAAEDAAQATFLVLMHKARSLPAKTFLPGWLYLTAQYSARQINKTVSRRMRREREAVSMLEDTRAANDAAAQAWESVKPQLDAALASLPKAQRDAILLRYLYGRSQAEAAQELDCPEGTLHSRVKRGLAKLREKFRRRGAALSITALLFLLEQNRLHAAPPALSAKILAVAQGQALATPAAAAAAHSVIQATAFWFTVKTVACVAVAVIGISTTATFALRAHSAAQSPETVAEAPAPIVDRPSVNAPPAPRLAAPAPPAPAPAPVAQAVPAPAPMDPDFKDHKAWQEYGNLQVTVNPPRLEISTVVAGLTEMPGPPEYIKGFAARRAFPLADGPVLLHMVVTIPDQPAVAIGMRCAFTESDTIEKLLPKRLDLIYDGNQLIVQSACLREFLPGRVGSYYMTSNQGLKGAPLGEFPNLAPGKHTFEMRVSSKEFWTQVDHQTLYRGPHSATGRCAVLGFYVVVEKNELPAAQVEIEDVRIGPAVAPENNF